MFTALTNRPQIFYGPRLPSQTRIGRAIEVLAYMNWNHGPQAAYAFYRDYIELTAINVAVSHEIESRAFLGTMWADLFELVCGYELSESGTVAEPYPAPCGWTHVEGGATSA